MIPILIALLAAPAPPVPPADTVTAVRREARNAAFRYEFALRRHIPNRFGSYGFECDEVIGRFCFRFDDRDRPGSLPLPDPPEVVAARVVAIAVHRRWFSLSPADSDAAGPLVRYLIEADRPAEGVAAARAHAWAADRGHRSLMILGMALHHDARFEAAEAVFDSARALLEPADRRRLDSVEHLLDAAEARLYRRLDPADRAAYETRLWALADPFHSQPGNERRSAHYARHAMAVVLAGAPRARGMLSWGDDHTQILLRYGVPSRRERILESGPTLSEGAGLVEMFDPLAIALVPPALLSAGMPGVPEDVWTRSELERDSARSTYTPVRHPRTRGMTVQVSRFPAPPGATLVVTASLAPDTLEPSVPVAPRGWLTLLDTMGVELARREATLELRADSVLVVEAAAPARPGVLIYHLEVVDDSSRLAGLSRHAVHVPEPAGLVLSDVVVAEPFTDSLPRSFDDRTLRSLPGPLVAQGGSVGLYAEVAGLDRSAGASRYSVEWAIEAVDRGSIIARAARWVGERLGVLQPEQPVSIRWDDGSPDAAATIAFTLDLAPLEPGLHRIILTGSDALSGETRSSSRVVRISAGPQPGRAAR